MLLVAGALIETESVAAVGVAVEVFVGEGDGLGRELLINKSLKSVAIAAAPKGATVAEVSPKISSMVSKVELWV